ncbi:MAG: hypothetical protein V3T39_08405 [Gammaproteobacteria bacterium]
MAAVVFSVVIPASALAQKESHAAYNPNTFEIGLGLFRPDVDTKIRADAPGIGGTDINLESDLAINNSKTLAYLILRWYIADRHALDFGYFDLERNGAQTLRGDITFDGTTFQVNTTVNSTFHTEIYKLSYTYEFFRSNSHSLGVTGGLHWTSLFMSINEPVFKTSDTVSTDAPLPLVGIGYRYKFSDIWRFGLSGELFRLEIGNIEGDFTRFNLGAHYSFTKRWAIAFGFTYFNMDITVKKANIGDIGLSGRFVHRYRGPSAILVIGF